MRPHSRAAKIIHSSTDAHAAIAPEVRRGLCRARGRAALCGAFVLGHEGAALNLCAKDGHPRFIASVPVEGAATLGLFDAARQRRFVASPAHDGSYQIEILDGLERPVWKAP